MSIKPGDPAAHNPQFHSIANGHYNVEDQTTLGLILYAFDLDETRLIHVPDWVKNDRYSIDAVPPDTLPAASGQEARHQMKLMLQAMLADRFQLAAHRETRRLAVYELVVAKSGSKFPAPGAPGQRPPMVGPKDPKNPDILRQPNPGETSAGIAGIASLPGFLASQLGRPVVDKTGIAGDYEIRLIWTPQVGEATAAMAGAAPASAPSATIFTALEEQLGLHLQAANDPVEVLVIDQISRPTPN